MQRTDATMKAGAALGVLAAMLTAVFVARSPVLDLPLYNAALRTLVLLAGTGAALITWHQRPRSRMGPVMMALALASALTSLQAAPQPALYAVGRLMLPICGAMLVLHAFLVFPSGRLEGRGARWALAATVATTALPWLLIALTQSPLPTTGLLSRCEGACPRNPLQLVDGSPALADAAVLAANGGQTLAACAVALVLLGRLRGARPVERLALGAALVPLVVLASGYALRFALNAAGLESRAADLSWLYGPLFVLIPLALLAGQLRGRLFAGAALRGMLSQLGPHPSAAAVERAMAEAFGDPSLRVAYRAAAGDRFLDAAGSALPVPDAAAPGVAELWDGGVRVAVILHDPALDDVPGLMGSARDAALPAVRNARLSADLRSSVRALHESRGRIAAAVDAARRTLERDLAGGAMPQLAAVRAQLAAAAEQAADAPARELLGELLAATELARETLGDAAHGIYPRLLIDGGLPAALRSAADDSSAVRTSGALHRGPPATEAAVYFACLEAAQNARKHTAAATTVDFALRVEDEVLHFAVRDDGAGFDVAATAGGSGLTNIHDRIAAVGGEVAIVSGDGRGTTLRGSVPWPAPAFAAASAAEDAEEQPAEAAALRPAAAPPRRPSRAAATEPRR